MCIRDSTETKKKGTGSENLGYYDHFYSGVAKEKRAQEKRVSILIRKNLRRFITNWEAVNERIIKMNLTIYGYRITILGIYAITEDALIELKDRFFEQLHQVISTIGSSREIILLGDLNSRVGKQEQSKVVGKHGENILNENGKKLIEVCEQNELRILNGFYPHKEIHMYTWTQNFRQLKSIIDYVIIKQKTKMKVQDVRVYRGATCGSDHYLLKTRIAFPRRKESNKEHTKTENQQGSEKEVRYNLNSLDHDSVRTVSYTHLDVYKRQEY